MIIINVYDKSTFIYHNVFLLTANDSEHEPRVRDMSRYGSDLFVNNMIRSWC